MCKNTLAILPLLVFFTNARLDNILGLLVGTHEMKGRVWLYNQVEVSRDNDIL